MLPFTAGMTQCFSTSRCKNSQTTPERGARSNTSTCKDDMIIVIFMKCICYICDSTIVVTFPHTYVKLAHCQIECPPSSLLIPVIHVELLSIGHQCFFNQNNYAMGLTYMVNYNHSYYHIYCVTGIFCGPLFDTS